jgi:histone H3/H4
MSKNKTKLPLGTIERMLKESTSMDIRISNAATVEMQKILGEVLDKFAKAAENAAKFANRTTIKDRDIFYVKENSNIICK